MSERPIIFNSEMVRAVMEGRKVQTRRAVKFPLRDKDLGCELSGNELAGEVSGGNYRNCPFGAVGDRLWVRETWSDVNFEGVPAVAYRADGGVRPVAEDDGDESDPKLEKYWFANWYSDLISGVEGNWRPSIHMPRWASRITLEITGVRVERLQDISREDAIAEGGPPSHPSIDAVSRDYGFPDFSRSWFGQTWWSIYGEESWQANPWVWVINFRRVQ